MDKIEITTHQGDGPNWVNCDIKLNGKLLENVARFEVKQSVGELTTVILELSEPEMLVDFVSYVEAKPKHINWRKRYE